MTELYQPIESQEIFSSWHNNKDGVHFSDWFRQDKIHLVHLKKHVLALLCEYIFKCTTWVKYWLVSFTMWLICTALHLSHHFAPFSLCTFSPAFTPHPFHLFTSLCTLLINLHTLFTLCTFSPVFVLVWTLLISLCTFLTLCTSHKTSHPLHHLKNLGINVTSLKTKSQMMSFSQSITIYSFLGCKEWAGFKGSLNLVFFWFKFTLKTRQFGTLPIGIVLSNLHSRHLETSPRTLFGPF